MKRNLLMSAILFLFAKIVFCTTLRVPQDYTSIQAAIDAAQKGDTVLVAEGIYQENIDFKGKGIVVASNYIFTKDWQTVRNTIIDGSKPARKDSASTVRFLSKEDSTAVLEGFTITGGSGTAYAFTSSKFQEGAGVILDQSSAIVRNNIIRDNTMVPVAGVQNGGGGGIASMYGNPTISNNLIVNNNSGYAGGIVLNWSGGKVRNNIVFHNTGGAGYGCGGIMIWKPSAIPAFVENNTIVGNYSYKDAGGMSIAIEGSYIPTVRNNIVWGNRQVVGPQVTDQYKQYLRYSDIEDFSAGTNISQYPQFKDSSFTLETTSPCIDAGDTSAICSDIEDPSKMGFALQPSEGLLRNDIGSFGGKFVEVLPSFLIRDLYLSRTSANLKCNKDSSGILTVEILNTGSGKLVIDSITVNNKSIFSVSENFSGKILDLLANDTIEISYLSPDTGTFRDTVKIYHNASPITSPSYIVLKLAAVNPTGVEEQSSIPNEFKLQQNFPNPFNPTTSIRYHLSQASHITLKVYDTLGREIRTLINEVEGPGEHEVKFDATTLPSGVYLYRITAGNFVDTKKLMLVK